MPSTVGYQRVETRALQQAVQLEFDCVRAYSVAAGCACDPTVRDAYFKVALECQQHAKVWQARLAQMGAAAATPNRVTQFANGAKVKLAALFGDRALARAVRNNAADSIDAYSRVAKRMAFTSPTRATAAEFLADARKHFAWIVNLLRGGRVAPGQAA